MDRNRIGNTVWGVGFGIILSAIIYPLGYLKSLKVFGTMIIVGSLLQLIGSYIEKPSNRQPNQ